MAMVASCGGGTASDSTQNGGSTRDSCTRLVNQSCAKAMACEPLVAQTLYADVPDCVAMTSRLCTGIAELPGSGQIVADFDACAAAYESLSCDSLLAGELPAACKGKPGTLADGTACAASTQCQSSYCKIDSSGASDCGVCAARSPAGGSCQASAACDEGLVCDYGSSTPVCVTASGAGSSCDSTSVCGDRLYCIGGICSTPLAAGATCTSAGECDYSRGLSCTSGVCQSITVVGTGQTCDNLALRCRAQAYCSDATDAGTRTCIARVPDGGACTEDIECQFFSECINGVCTPFSFPTCQ
jgi:hypothetical protein